MALTFSRENFETQLGEIVRENQDLADLSGRYEPFAESMRVKLAIRDLAEKIRFWPLPNEASTEGGWICLRRVQVKQRQDLASSDWEVCPEGKLIGQWTRAGQYWEWALLPDGQLKKRQVVYDDSWQVVESKPWQKEHTITYLKWQESLEGVLSCWQRLEAEGAIDHRISCEGGFLVATLA